MVDVIINDCFPALPGGTSRERHATAIDALAPAIDNLRERRGFEIFFEYQGLLTVTYIDTETENEKQTAVQHHILIEKWIKILFTFDHQLPLRIDSVRKNILVHAIDKFIPMNSHLVSFSKKFYPVSRAHINTIFICCKSFYAVQWTNRIEACNNTRRPVIHSHRTRAFYFPVLRCGEQAF